MYLLKLILYHKSCAWRKDLQKPMCNIATSGSPHICINLSVIFPHSLVLAPCPVVTTTPDGDRPEHCQALSARSTPVFPFLTSPTNLLSCVIIIIGCSPPRQET
jgi:hypothetical protein